MGWPKAGVRSGLLPDKLVLEIIEWQSERARSLRLLNYFQLLAASL